MNRRWHLICMVLVLSGTGLAQDTLRAIQLKSGNKLLGWVVDRIEGRSALVRLQSHRGIVVLWSEIASVSLLPGVAGAIVDQDTLPPLPRREPLPFTWFCEDRSGARHTELRLDSARGDILYASTGPDKRRSSIAIPITSLARLGHETGGGFFDGALKGAGIGAVGGGIIGGLSYSPRPNAFLDLGPGPAIAGGAIAGFLGGFVIGGVVGSSTKYERLYEFSLLNGADAVKAAHHLFFDSLSDNIPTP